MPAACVGPDTLLTHVVRLGVRQIGAGSPCGYRFSLVGPSRTPLARHNQTCRHYLAFRFVGTIGMVAPDGGDGSEGEPLHPPSTSQAGPGQKSRFSGRTLVAM